MSLEQVDRLRAMLLARRGETPTIEERRARLVAQWAAPPLPDDIGFTPTRIRDDLRGLWVDAPGGRQDRVMLWLHGGAFMLGSAQSYRDFGARLARAAGVLQACPVFIDDSPGLTLMEMRSKARRLRVENEIGLVIVDYLQLMKSPEYAQNRVQEISDISRSLKQLARELHVPVIALSQLSRAAEQRGGERIPMLSDLRDSGAIEQDADVVVFIHRPEYYADLRAKAEQEGKNIEGVADVIVAKHRNGPTGNISLFFHRRFTRFDNLSARPTGPPDGPEDY